MPRVRKRVTNRGVPLNILERASDVIRDEGRTVRAVAKDFAICHTTLFRFNKKREKLTGEGSDTLPRAGYWTSRKVFSEDQERSLREYLKRAADLYYWLDPKEVRKFAFQLASRYNCNFPPKWSETSMAGVDWFTGFLKRHPSLSIRRPRATVPPPTGPPSFCASPSRPSTSGTGTDDLSPEAIRPHPKAGARNKCAKGRRRRSTAILTDTPVKEELETDKKLNSAAEGKENHKGKCIEEKQIV
ncbi:unnamed protein product [Leuciscus chuanchicus]